MFSSLPKSYFRVALLLGGVALGLAFVPPAQVDLVRTNLLDALKPGLDCLKVAENRWQEIRPALPVKMPQFSQEDNSGELARLNRELDALAVRERRLKLANAELHRQITQLKKTGLGPYPSRPGKPLVEVELLEASVLSRESGSVWQAEGIINLGRRDGLSENELILAGEGPLIDQGQEADLAPGQPVYSGRAVVGRLAKVGRALSTIQKVTDESYRGHAQLVRKTKNGFVFGAQGVIEGQGGDRCLLRYVANTEPVEVGDEVYTSGHDRSQPEPMYYGKVVRAELKPGEQEWMILIEPAVKKVESPTVTVLRTELDVNRTLTN